MSFARYIILLTIAISCPVETAMHLLSVFLCREGLEKAWHQAWIPVENCIRHNAEYMAEFTETDQGKASGLGGTRTSFATVCMLAYMAAAKRKNIQRKDDSA